MNLPTKFCDEPEKMESHPEPKLLAEFLQGKLPEEQSATVEVHIESCETCCEKLALVEDDPFINLAQQAGQDFSQEETPEHSLFELDFSAKEEEDAIQAINKNGRYEIIKKIGSGGMGNVYHARHRLMKRDVALKVIHPKWTNRPEAVARFQQEVQNLAKLNHKNIVTSFDAEQANGSHFLVMELIQGRSAFEKVNQDGPMTAAEAIRVVIEVASGLEVAQKASLVHRDIKPQNIMLEGANGVKILDFGLTRLRQDAAEKSESDFEAKSASSFPATSDLTGTHIALGTPDYLAPEQAKNATAADVRSDLYSLGCTFFFLLTGRPPFRGKDAYQTIGNHLSADPPKLNLPPHSQPNPVCKLAEKMVEKSPALRFQNPSELISACELVLLELPSTPQPPASATAKSATSTKGTISRRGSIIAVGIAILTIGGLALASGPAGKLFTAPKKRVVIVCPKQTYYPDFQPVAKKLIEEGFDVKVASPAKTVRPVLESQGQPFQADLLLKDIEPSQFDAIVFVGGNMRNMEGESKTSQQVKTLVHQFLKEEKLVSAICAGTVVLKQTGLPTSDPDDDSPVFRSDQVIAAPTNEHAAEFVKQISLRLKDH